MRMLSIIAASAVISLSAPALAETADTTSFKHDGYTYVYKVEQKEGAQVISGRRYPDGAKFSLRVRDGKVAGLSNGVSVRFGVADAKGAATSAKPAKLSMR